MSDGQCGRFSDGHYCTKPPGHEVVIGDRDTWHSDGRSLWVSLYDLPRRGA